MKKNRLITITLLIAAFAGCQKDAKTTNVDKTKNANTEISVHSDSLNSGQDTPGGISPVIKPFFIKNCGIATLPNTPVAGNGTVIFPVGTIIAVNQPSTETQYPSSVLFGPPAGTPLIPPYGGPKYKFTVQGDGNIVLYLNGTTTSLWDSQTQTGGAFKQINSYVILQSDGNLVLRQRDKNNVVVEVWASHQVICNNQNAPILAFQEDGNVVEKYPCAHIGSYSYGFVGNTGTNGGIHSNHLGKFQ